MRVPSQRVWQLLRTNVTIPKRSRSGSIAIKSQPTKSIIKNKKRGQWKVDDMHLALATVASKTMSIRKAGEFYGIPPSSIQDWKKDNKI